MNLNIHYVLRRTPALLLGVIVGQYLPYSIWLVTTMIVLLLTPVLYSIAQVIRWEIHSRRRERRESADDAEMQAQRHATGW